MNVALAAAVRPSRVWPTLDGLGALVRAASSPRFRAAARPRMRSSVRQAMWLAVLAAVVDCAWLVPGHPDAASRIVAANGFVAVVAVVAFIAVGRWRHLSPEMLVFAVLLAVDASIGVVIGIDARVFLLGAGYVLLLPPVVALLIPWRTFLHATWLLTHAVAAVALAGLAPVAAIAIDGPRTLMALLVVSSAGSILGHLANLRGRVVSFGLIERIKFMNRQARRDQNALEQLNARLAQVAWTDRLTGLGNRLALQRQLAVVRSRISRLGDRYALLMLDLDHFKVINDTLGHFTGDDVLRRVAAAVQTATRASDATYRFGGEEFVVVVGLAHGDEAMAVAERLRRSVEALGIAHPGNPPYGVATVSIGVAVIDGARLDDTDDAWLQSADGALYVAKRSGRNRCVAA
jgi:diguanylate cyclase (GGDEF)-like protein